MDDKKNTPNKNLVQNEIPKNKIFFLPSCKPIDIRQVSSQFRQCNIRYFPNNNEKTKSKNFNINSIKNTNIFRLNAASKYKVSLSQEKEDKTRKIHEENEKKMKELQKILEDLEKKNISFDNEINKLSNDENNLKNDLQKKDDEEKELTTELDNLKNINEEKNREYLHLQQISQENANNNNGLNNNNRPRQRAHNINNNNPENNNEDDQASEIDLLNRLLRLQRQVMGNNEGERGVEGEGNNIDNSLNNSNYDLIELLNEDLGPPMTLEQIEALPSEKYPKKDTYDEKCILCGFNLCYNDSINKLEQCQHIFHKECFSNFLINRQASKCPICKVSLT